MNITTTLGELDAYFKRLVDSHPNINSVVIGDSEQILSIDRSKIEYPCLWVETPNVDWHLKDNPKRYYSFGFVVLANVPADRWLAQRYALHTTLEITEQLLTKIKDDSDENLIFIEQGTATSYPVLGYGHDHDFGWRTTMRIRASMAPCADSCVWTDVCPVGSLVRFKWENNNLGDFSDIVFTDTSLPTTESWTFLWTWQIDGGTINTSATPPPINQAAGNYMYVTMKITSGSCVLIASALVLNNQGCGESVPYLIDKPNS